MPILPLPVRCFRRRGDQETCRSGLSLIRREDGVSRGDFRRIGPRVRLRGQLANSAVARIRNVEIAGSIDSYAIRGATRPFFRLTLQKLVTDSNAMTTAQRMYFIQGYHFCQLALNSSPSTRLNSIL